MLLELPHAFANGHTVGHATNLGLALSRMDLKQCPNALAHIAATGSFDLTLGTVLEKTLHLGAVGRWALGRVASSGV